MWTLSPSPLFRAGLAPSDRVKLVPAAAAGLAFRDHLTRDRAALPDTLGYGGAALRTSARLHAEASAMQERRRGVDVGGCCGDAETVCGVKAFSEGFTTHGKHHPLLPHEPKGSSLAL